MPGFSELELNELDFKNYMDPSALIDTLSPNDMWNGYNFFNDDNINTSIKDDIKEENLDMDCCFSSICPNDLINSIESSLIKSNSLQDENYDYKSISSSSSVSPDTHSLDTFDFVPCILQEPQLNASSDLLTIGLDSEKGIKYELDSMSSSPCSSSCSTLPSPSQNTQIEQKSGQIYQIQNLQQSNNLLKKSSVISLDKAKIKSSILPPSPPSSFGSDSESNQSCQSVKKSLASSQTIVLKKNNSKNGTTIVKQIRHQPYQVKSSNSHIKNKSINNSKSNNSSNSADDDCWPFFVSLSKLPSSGPILLTEEEKRTLIQEGHQVPTQLPLTKSEEKILKKIRRKIKNKISAQESRRKKKEYVDSLERRMENYINENQELKKRLEDLELNNKNLLLQLEKMKSSLTQSSQSLQPTSQTNITDFNQSQVNTNQFSTLIMVLVLFFTVVFGIWSPVITKDQLTNSAACTAASVTTNTINRSQTASSSVAVVAIATAAAAATVSAKADAQNEEPKQQSLKPIVTFDDDSQSLKRKHEDEDFNILETSQAVSHNNLIARSKTGTAVELTKVRPFIGKLPTITKSPNVVTKPNLPSTNQTTSQNDYIILNNSNEESQIIILNLANNNAQESSKNNIRVINSNQAATGSKLQTRFRVINNGQNYNSINQAVIKLSSS